MRRICMVVFDDIQSLDVVGPVDVFAAADALTRQGGKGGAYSVEIVSVDGSDVTSTSGVRLGVDGALPDLADPPDTVIVAGGEGVRVAVDNTALIEWVAAVRPRRMASVCSGAFVLARAGLLAGRSATTHWSVTDILAELHPEIEVHADPIFVTDGHITTAAGVTAGLDLALSFVEDDLGPRIALGVARHLVVFVRRPGGQAQFSTQMAVAPANTPVIRQAQEWIAEHPAEDLTVAALAARFHLSERHFARRFSDETGSSVARYVENTRLEVGRRLLEQTDLPVATVARSSGFAVADTFARLVQRRLGVNPADYRERFSSNRHSADNQEPT